MNQSPSLNARSLAPHLTRLLAALAVAMAAPMVHADSGEIVQRIPGAPGHTVWQITRPRVNQARTEYEQIKFAPATTVSVTASGCVQTGGGGRSWKRYVDPAGDKSQTLYHGLIDIPGATAGLVDFQPEQPTVYTIPLGSQLPADAHLSLGYTDDAVKDNGYWKHDDGNLNQCWNVGDATVVIDIAPETKSPAPPPVASYVFTIENVTIRNLRSRENDTDVIAGSVTVDGTQSDVATQPVGDWKRGSHPANFQILVDQVAPTDRIAVNYAIANAGHGNENTIDDKITSTVATIASKVPGAGSLVAAVASIWDAGFNLADPDCDGPVVAGIAFGTGTELFLRTQSGEYRRTLSFAGSDSATGCGSNSFYEVTYSVRPSTQVQSYLARVDARTLAVTPAAGIRILRHK